MCRLFDSFRQGDLSAVQISRLKHLLATSDEAVRSYVELMHQHAALRLMFGPPIQLGAGDGQANAATAMPNLPRELREIVDAEKISNARFGSILDVLQNDPLDLDRNASSSVNSSIWLPFGNLPFGQIVFAIGLATTMLLAIFLLWPGSGGGNAKYVNNTPNQESGKTHPTLGIGDIRIDSGTARFQLPNVGYIIIDGPAELKMLTPMRICLNSGRIRVRVTEPSGHGFVVVTPHGEVTDLGTEFGIDVSDVRPSDLVVFDGSVDLCMPGAAANPPTVERLVGGEGVRFDRDGNFDRISSINTGHLATFERTMDLESRDEMQPVIISVSDNLRINETKRFYEIVHHGLQEDVLAFVDRPYQWNGMDKSGMPEFLVGAHYVKMFNHYRQQSFQITMTLAQAADLYIFWDNRVPKADWLLKDFEDTGLVIGLDSVENEYNPDCSEVLGVGPGVEVDQPYSIWHRRVLAPGEVKLGPLACNWRSTAMYGIAAVALPPESRKNANVKKTIEKK